MDFDTLGEIIATRRLYLIDEENVRRTVSVLVGKPQPRADESSYFCPFQIIGIGSQNTHLAEGTDSVQALQSAMILIAANLNHLNDELAGRLRWNGDGDDLGFP
jgi:hypothetical protein